MELVVDILARGYPARQIVAQYDHVAVDDVQACLAYAAEALQSEKVYALHSRSGGDGSFLPSLTDS